MNKSIKKINQIFLKKSMKIELSAKYCCYVLITCDEPNKQGDMQVEMTYEGDPVLASYLIQKAQDMI